MHMQDLKSVELDTIRTSRNPTWAITANGEVQTNKKATVCVYDLDFFVTTQILKDTPAVLSLGNLCDDHGYPCEWTSGQKPHLIKDGRRMKCSTESFVPIVAPEAHAVEYWETSCTVLNNQRMITRTSI